MESEVFCEKCGYTEKVLFENDKTSYKETDTLGGYDPYSASKASCEILFKSYIKSYFNKKNSKIKICTVRAGNVVGGGDWSQDRLIPDCIRCWSKKKIHF